MEEDRIKTIPFGFKLLRNFRQEDHLVNVPLDTKLDDSGHLHWLSGMLDKPSLFAIGLKFTLSEFSLGSYVKQAVAFLVGFLDAYTGQNFGRGLQKDQFTIVLLQYFLKIFE